MNTLSLAEASRTVVQRLHTAGHRTLYAGGCVRDQLRGQLPHDYDVATAARPEQVQALFPRTVAVGAHFGVIDVMESGHTFQVATFRDDGIYVDGRHPEAVVFSTPERDAQRRDFTINGLFYDPLREELIDYVGGQADLAAGVLRAIGDPAARFREDRLRMLRAVRFTTTLGFEIEPATWAAVQAHAAHIGEVSAERIREELNKIFLSPHRVQGLDLLESSGLLHQIIPEMSLLRGCEQPPAWHPEGDVWVHTRLMLSLLGPEVSLPLVWSVLLHDIAKPATWSLDPAEGRIRFSGHDRIGARMAEEIMLRLRFPRKEIEATVEAVADHMVFKDVPQMRASRLRRFMAKEHFEDELELHRVDCTASHGFLDNYTFLRTKQEEFAHEPLIPPPLLRGADLIALGHRPGPRFKEILDAVQSRQLEGTLHTPEEAQAWVQAEWPVG